ncbi:TrbI/VirB10 family protein [Brevundimonas viscosa]|uniref:Type IV secretion system protein VirB10 n=1 Tax=Brevundimonas viscosa TaxID=871741 RepID=A0A1I6TN45_9CAUL|nr:TrbI/VirB10 family protein [Brevundimonas viscosa]SFS90653.1 type IV secretion system protein VirB10 [Brevundimonas viscosa]
MTDPKPPLPKSEPPPLSAFAPRPRAIRIRKGAAHALALAAAAVVAGSLTWAFVLDPHLKSQARERQRALEAPGETGPVRPSERITAQPAAYDRLPPPRTFGRPETPDPALAPRRATPERRRPLPDTVGRPRGTAAGTRSGEISARAQAAGSDLFFPAGLAPGGEGPGRASAERGGQGDSPLTVPRSPYQLQAGTLIPAVLLTGVDTTRPGPAIALVSRPVYDTVSGRHLLIPQGSRLIGRQAGDSAHGERRVYLVWERLILPDGASLHLEDEPTVDAQGAPGAPGRVDRRLWPMAAASMLAGAITAIGELARGGSDERDRISLVGTAGDAAAIEAAQLGGRLIDRELEVRTVVRVAPGEPVRVLLTRDLVLEPRAS